jgi:hypothetical protein
MIDFSKITQTLDGFDCHYFGQRNVFISGSTWRVHSFSIFHPDMGPFEKWYDDQGHRLSVVGGRIVKSNSKKYRIVEASDGH